MECEYGMPGPLASQSSELASIIGKRRWERHPIKLASKIKPAAPIFDH
jgi:hypothetical protein